MGGGHIRRLDLVYPDLSYAINGVLFDVFRQLGGGHEERHYQKAVTLGLKAKGIKFKEQYFVPLKFNGSTVGKYFLDFLVEEKIILELKRGKFLNARVIEQVKQYLTSLNLPLALIACFTYNGVFSKRILNLK